MISVSIWTSRSRRTACADWCVSIPTDKQASRPGFIQTSMPKTPDTYKFVSGNKEARPIVKIFWPWGHTSLLVSYNGPYASDRPPHIKLRESTSQDWPKHVTIGSQFELFELHRKGSAVMWKVRGLFQIDGTPAHFTVHHGPWPLGHFELVPPQYSSFVPRI